MNAGRSMLLQRRFVTAVLAAMCLIPVLVWVVSVGNPFQYLSKHVPPGQVLYVVSKLLAMIALALLWLQCMTALARVSPVLRGFPSLARRQHIALGATTAALVLAHVATFIAASSLRTQHLALDLLLPQFDNGFFSSYVSVGAIAFWLMLVVVVAGCLRMRAFGAARWLHRISFLVMSLAFLHGISIGSETRFGLMAYVYAFIGLSFGVATLSWWWQFGNRLGVVRAQRKQAIEAVAPDTSSHSI